jgi:predicted DNA-binding transcriptional regulator AlpA
MLLIVARELMGAAEIAERLGVSRQRVQQLIGRADWPAPAATLEMGRVWRTDEVEAWIREHRPQDEDD